MGQEVKFDKTLQYVEAVLRPFTKIIKFLDQTQLETRWNCWIFATCDYHLIFFPFTKTEKTFLKKLNWIRLD